MAASRPRLTRRSFVQRLSFFGGGVLLLGSCEQCGGPKVTPVAVPQGLSTSHQSFTNTEFAVVEAATERILPKDEDVGAKEAGVPVYIDRMLQTPQLAQMREDFVAGLAALERRARRTFKVGFAEASSEQQDQLLNAFKNSGPKSGEAHFFELLLVLTLEGFLGDPSYGGNKNKAGWALMGFSTIGTQASSPPKGYDGMKCLRECGHHP